MHSLRSLPVILLICTATAVAAGTFPPDAVTWTATMPDKPLKVGERYRLKVEVVIDGEKGYRPYGEHANGAFVVQVDAPECVRPLAGDPLRPFDSPYEHAVMDFPMQLTNGPIKGEAWIDFKMRRKPKPGDVIGLNLCGYIQRTEPKKTEDGETKNSTEIWFVRMRGSLLPEQRAEMRESDPMRSSWGPFDNRLQIGDMAEPFTLPDMVDTDYDLRDFIGRYYVVVAMYRDHTSRFGISPLFNLHLNWDAFDALGARVIGVSKEDETAEDFAKFVSRMRPHPPRTIFLWDEGGAATRRYDPLTYYLIDLDGRVRQIFPGTYITRCPPKALLREIERVMAEDGVEPPKIEPATQPAEGDEAAAEPSEAAESSDGP